MMRGHSHPLDLSPVGKDTPPHSPLEALASRSMRSPWFVSQFLNHGYAPDANAEKIVVGLAASRSLAAVELSLAMHRVVTDARVTTNSCSLDSDPTIEF